MASNLNNHQLNTDCYMQKMLHTSLMGTTNQKPLIDMQRIKRKKYKYIITETHQTMKKRKIRKKTDKNFRNNP